MNVFAGIAACFRTVKIVIQHKPLLYVYSAFAHGFFTMLERSTDVVQQRNGNFFMMKTVCKDVILQISAKKSYVGMASIFN